MRISLAWELYTRKIRVTQVGSDIFWQGQGNPRNTTEVLIMAAVAVVLDSYTCYSKRVHMKHGNHWNSSVWWNNNISFNQVMVMSYWNSGINAALRMTPLFTMTVETMNLRGVCVCENVRAWFWVCEYCYCAAPCPALLLKPEVSNIRGFGHIAFAVDDVYATSASLESAGVSFIKRPDEGRMKGLAFCLGEHVLSTQPL